MGAGRRHQARNPHQLERRPETRDRSAKADTGTGASFPEEAKIVLLVLFVSSFLYLGGTLALCPDLSLLSKPGRGVTRFWAPIRTDTDFQPAGPSQVPAQAPAPSPW